MTTWYMTPAGSAFNGGTGKGAPLSTGTDGVSTSSLYAYISSYSATWTSAIVGQGMGLNLSGSSYIVGLIQTVQPSTTLTVTTSSGSTTVTSAALFTSAMVGQLITGPGIPSGSNIYISAFTNSSTVTISAAASTGFGTGTATLYPYVKLNNTQIGVNYSQGVTSISWAVGGAFLGNASGPAGGGYSAGDTIYIGGGTYYSSNLSTASINLTYTSGTSGSPVSFIGDITGQYTGYPGEVFLAGAPSNSSWAGFQVGNAASSYINYSNLTINGQVILGPNSNITDCVVVNYQSGANLISMSPAAAYNSTVDRCVLHSGTAGIPITVVLTTNTTADFDANIVIRNSLIIWTGYVSATGAIHITASGTSSKHGGGVRVYDCSIFAPVYGVSCATATYLSTTYPCEVHNSVVYTPSIGLNAATSGQMTASYVLTNNTTNVTNTNVTLPGTNNYELGQSLKVSGVARPPFTPASGSYALGYGTGGTGGNYPTVDFLSRPRPSGGGSGNNALGYLERHDFAIQDTTTYPTGYTSSAKLVGPGDQYLFLPVDATATTISLQVYQGSGYTGTNYATATIVANPELGITAQTVTATSTKSAWQTLTFSSITPSKQGFITLQVTSYDTSGTGTLNFGAIL